MNLHIVRYINYGKRIWSDPNFFAGKNGKRDKFSNNFYFTLFEINNGKIIEIIFIENLLSGKILSTELNTYYAMNYNFGEDFTLWWNRQMSEPNNNIEYLKDDVKDDEDKLVRNFYENKIEKKRAFTTSIVNLV